MNQKNLEYLQEGLKYLGFGEGLNERLKEEIGKGKPEFQLNTINEYGRDKVSYALDFRKSDSSDMYFFNKYAATFTPQNSEEERSQTFYVKKNAGITAKEAYNLLSGRAVNKDLTNAEGQPYNAWMQIDFRQKDNHGNHKYKLIHHAYGFDLEKELRKHPIQELNDATSKERLMKSLERGNLHQVTFAKADREDKMFVEANPQFKTLNLYNDKMKKVFIENSNQKQIPEDASNKKQPESQKESEVAEKKQEKQNNGMDAEQVKDKQKQLAGMAEMRGALNPSRKQVKRHVKL